MGVQADTEIPIRSNIKLERKEAEKKGIWRERQGDEPPPDLPSGNSDLSATQAIAAPSPHPSRSLPSISEQTRSMQAASSSANTP